MKQQELAENSQFFQRVLRMDNFGQNSKRGTFAKFSNSAIEPKLNSLIIANTSRIAKFSNKS